MRSPRRSAGAPCRPRPTGSAAVAAVAALALLGCESSQDKSAKLEKSAKRREAAALAQGAAAERARAITRPGKKVTVAGVTLLRSDEGLATVVTLHNRTGSALREVPVKVVVSDSGGHQLYTNATPGQSPALVSVATIPPHGRVDWIDDQIPPQSNAAKAAAIAGEASPAGAAAPKLTVRGAHVVEDPSSGPGAEGEVVNDSDVTQRELVVYAVASRAGRVVAAGRAVLPEAASHTPTRFQLFFIGDPHGAKLTVVAPPSTLR